MAPGQEIRLPIAHHDGNYFADPGTLDRLEGDGRIAFRYLGNPNGSLRDIAGILSENGRVLGMMPHPERAADPGHGGTDGRGALRRADRDAEPPLERTGAGTYTHAMSDITHTAAEEAAEEERTSPIWARAAIAVFCVIALAVICLTNGYLTERFTETHPEPRRGAADALRRQPDEPSCSGTRSCRSCWPAIPS